MQHAAFEIGKIHLLRVDIGEDVLASVERFLSESGIQQAIVLGGYGTLTNYHLHWVTHNRLPTENTFLRGEGGIEILSMNGLVVNGSPHIHVSLSTPQGAFGGHLEPGCRAYVVCEIFFAEVAGGELNRTQAAVSIEGMGEGKVTRLTFD
ncbi:MAG: PPC domain-containing DNA-binding protein [Chloroflexota bacterium]